ncbi:MAG: hypothetical protein ACXWC0_28720 [Burkholderiales bacterium]
MSEAFHRANSHHCPFIAKLAAYRAEAQMADVIGFHHRSHTGLSATKNFLRSVQRRHHMIAARISFGFGLVSERNARQSMLVVKRKPKKQPAFKQLDVTNPPFLFH